MTTLTHRGVEPCIATGGWHSPADGERMRKRLDAMGSVSLRAQDPHSPPQLLLGDRFPDGIIADRITTSRDGAARTLRRAASCHSPITYVRCTRDKGAHDAS